MWSRTPQLCGFRILQSKPSAPELSRYQIKIRDFTPLKNYHFGQRNPNHSNFKITVLQTGGVYENKRLLLFQIVSFYRVRNAK